MNNEIHFQDAESQTFSSQGLTFKDIILAHIRKITQLSCVEMRGGFWEHKPPQNPNINVTIDIYIPDSRECFSNAVLCLYDMLYPYFDDKIMECQWESNGHR